MKAVLQRVAKANVVVDGQEVSAIEQGLLVLLGIEQGDSEADGSFLAQKIAELRIFSDEAGKMNKSVQDIGGSILLVSQFTLLADWKKGRRPGFAKAAAPDEANRLYKHFAVLLQELGLPVKTGIFAADMQVSLTNDGPVTLILEHQGNKSVDN